MTPDPSVSWEQMVVRMLDDLGQRIERMDQKSSYYIKDANV